MVSTSAACGLTAGGSKNSLFSASNSLFWANKFPVPIEAVAEQQHQKMSVARRFFAFHPAVASANSLLFSLLAGNYRGERFVPDCTHPPARTANYSPRASRAERTQFSNRFRAIDETVVHARVIDNSLATRNGAQVEAPSS